MILVYLFNKQNVLLKYKVFVYWPFAEHYIPTLPLYSTVMSHSFSELGVKLDYGGHTARYIKYATLFQVQFKQLCNFESENKNNLGYEPGPKWDLLWKKKKLGKNILCYYPFKKNVSPDQKGFEVKSIKSPW